MTQEELSKRASDLVTVYGGPNPDGYPMDGEGIVNLAKSFAIAELQAVKEDTHPRGDRSDYPYHLHVRKTIDDRITKLKGE